MHKMCVRHISDKKDFYTVDLPCFAYKCVYYIYIHLNEFTGVYIVYIHVYYFYLNYRGRGCLGRVDMCVTIP